MRPKKHETTGAKRAAMMAGRYAHAKQFNRHRRQLRVLRTRLGRLIRDIRRKIAGYADLEAAFVWPLARADQIRSQQQRQRGCKGRAGDAANVILSAVGYNLRLVLAWLRTILRVVLLALFQTFAIRLALKPAF